MAKNHCDFCANHWSTIVRLFLDEEDFKNSEYYDGEDKVKNDPHNVEIAVWAGKNNVGRNANNYWLCAPVHPFCGCHFEEYSFEKEEVKEDWYSKLDFSDL